MLLRTLRHLTHTLALATLLTSFAGLWPGAGVATPAPAHPPFRLLAVDTQGPGDLAALQELGLDVLRREDPSRALVAATDPEVARLAARGLRFTVLEPDLELATRRGLGPAADAYHSFEEVVAELDRLRAARPDLVGPRLTIGRSWEGRPLLAVKISDHPEIDEDEPEVLYDALHHAREPIGMETLLHTMSYLVESYDRDPEVRALVDERELWFVPVVNPDGYACGGIGGMWRKNRRPNADGSFGVDLNRNYGYQWGYDDLGSSPVPSSQTYRGPAPFSEPETAAMRDFILSHRFVTGMTLHAYSEINLLPYGWAEAELEDAGLYAEIAHDLEQLTGYPHGQPWELLYFSNGRTQDWEAHDAGMVAIEPEIGSAADGFWPPAERIAVLARQNLPALLHLARIAGAHVEPVSFEVRDARPPLGGDGDGLADPGETFELALLLRNKGLADLRHGVVTVTSTSPDLAVHAGPLAFGHLEAQASRRLEAAPLLLSLSPAAAPGAPIPLRVEVRGEPGFLSSATLELVPGTPSLVFADDAESGLGRWLATGGWGIASAPGPGPNSAFTDSPGGRYLANANSALVLSSPLDLTRARRAVLRYRELFATEPWDDLCHVEASAPGHGWTPLAVIPGGVESSFRERTVSLDQFAGQPQVRLRFRLTSNHSNQRDGWTLDDIQVWAYGSPEAASDLAAAAAAPAPPPAGQAASPTAHPGTAAE